MKHFKTLSPTSRGLIDRRTWLRGALGGVALGMALPLLEAMLNRNGTALASGAALPLRYGQWYWGCGAYRDGWVPTDVGPGWTPPAQLLPLAALRDDVSVLSGLTYMGPKINHYEGQAYALAGALDLTVPGDANDGVPGGPSIDQLVARAWAGRTPIASLQVGVSRQPMGGLPLQTRDASWIADNQRNYIEFSVAELYKTLFAASRVSTAAAARNQSVLDAVAADMQALRKRVGRADQLRLDGHAAAIRDIEVNLQRLTSTQCAAPQAVTEPPGGLSQEPHQARSRLFADMITLALSCDLTRVFTVQWTSVCTDAVFWEVGAQEGLHTLTHVGDAAAQATVRKALTFQMGELAYLLQKLKSTPDGAGSLLDNSCIYATSCLGDPTVHSFADIPMLIAGRAGGALKRGQHLRSDGSDLTTAAPLTVLRALGINAPSFGAGPFKTSRALTGLLV